MVHVKRRYRRYSCPNWARHWTLAAVVSCVSNEAKLALACTSKALLGAQPRPKKRNCVLYRIKFQSDENLGDVILSSQQGLRRLPDFIRNDVEYQIGYISRRASCSLHLAV